MIMAYPSTGLSNHGYEPDRGESRTISINHYPRNNNGPHQIQLNVDPNLANAVYNSSQHDYEELPFARSKKSVTDSPKLGHYAVSNEDYAYSIGDPSIASMPSNLSLDLDRQSRATSNLSMISEPRKRANPLYDKVERPVSKQPQPDSKPYFISKRLFVFFVVLIIILTILSVILLAIVISLLVSQSNDALKTDLANSVAAYEALQAQVALMDAKVTALSTVNGTVYDPFHIDILAKNVSRNQVDTELVSARLADHSVAAVANFTGIDAKFVQSTTRQDAAAVVVSTNSANVATINTTLNNFLWKGLGACIFNTSKASGQHPLKEALDSGAIYESTGWAMLASTCSIGGPAQQDYRIQTTQLTTDPSLTKRSCVCNGSPTDSTVLFRECRIHVILCRTDTATLITVTP